MGFFSKPKKLNADDYRMDPKFAEGTSVFGDRFNKANKKFGAQIDDLYQRGNFPITQSGALKKYLENLQQQNNANAERENASLEGNRKSMINKMLLRGGDGGALERLNRSALRGQTSAEIERNRNLQNLQSKTTLDDYIKQLQNRREDRLNALKLGESNMARLGNMSMADAQGTMSTSRFNTDAYNKAQAGNLASRSRIDAYNRNRKSGFGRFLEGTVSGLAKGIGSGIGGLFGG